MTQDYSRRRFLAVGGASVLGALLLDKFAWPINGEMLPKPKFTL